MTTTTNGVRTPITGGESVVYPPLQNQPDHEQRQHGEEPQQQQQREQPEQQQHAPFWDSSFAMSPPRIRDTTDAAATTTTTITANTGLFHPSSPTVLATHPEENRTSVVVSANQGHRSNPANSPPPTTTPTNLLSLRSRFRSHSLGSEPLGYHPYYYYHNNNHNNLVPSNSSIGQIHASQHQQHHHFTQYPSASWPLPISILPPPPPVPAPPAGVLSDADHVATPNEGNGTFPRPEPVSSSFLERSIDPTAASSTNTAVNTVHRIMDQTASRERQRAKQLQLSELTMTADELRLVLKQERHRMERIAVELAVLHYQSVQGQATAEIMEEMRINGLMRQVEQLQHEKGRIVRDLECEEEMMTNTLQKKLEELEREKSILQREIESKHYSKKPSPLSPRQPHPSLMDGDRSLPPPPPMEQQPNRQATNDTTWRPEDSNHMSAAEPLEEQEEEMEEE